MHVHAGVATYSYEELCYAADEKTSVMKLGRRGFCDALMGRLCHTLVVVTFFQSVSCSLSFLSICSHIHAYAMYMYIVHVEDKLLLIRSCNSYNEMNNVYPDSCVPARIHLSRDAASSIVM